MLDVFNTSAFDMVSMTKAIQKLPFQPGRVSAMGMFQPMGISTTTLVIDEIEGNLTLIDSSRRGSAGRPNRPVTRKARSQELFRFALTDQVLADDVQGIRAFGSDNQAETVAAVTNQKLQRMRNHFETMFEYMRINALQGVLKDGDASTTLVDLFSLFETSQQAVDFTWATPNTLAKSLAVTRAVEDALGAAAFDHVHALCSDAFWDNLIAASDVKTAYERWNDGQFLRTDMRAGFPFGGIIWENYRGSIGGSPFIASGDARFFPVGVADMYFDVYGPADYLETVNTLGQALYAKQRTLEFDRGVEIETQSNTISVCARPRSLVRGHSST